MVSDFSCKERRLQAGARRLFNEFLNEKICGLGCERDSSLNFRNSVPLYGNRVDMGNQ